jgi:hypothetical protein
MKEVDELWPVDQLRAAGITSANALAAALNAKGIATAHGKRWTAGAVISIEHLLQGSN